MARQVDMWGDPYWRIHSGGTRLEAKPFEYMGIGIAGKAGAGKTTLARWLSGKHSLPIHPLAESLKKDVLWALTKAGLVAPADELLVTNKELIRPILQGWGQLFRFYDENYWIDRLFKEHAAPFIIDDVRFLNELDALRRRGFFMVRIEVNPDQQWRRVPQMAAYANQDYSETALDKSMPGFDVILDGNKSIEEVRADFSTMAEQLRFSLRGQA